MKILVKHFNSVVNFLLPIVLDYHTGSSGIQVKLR